MTNKELEKMEFHENIQQGTASVSFAAYDWKIRLFSEDGTIETYCTGAVYLNLEVEGEYHGIKRYRVEFCVVGDKLEVNDLDEGDTLMHIKNPLSAPFIWKANTTLQTLVNRDGEQP